MADQEIKVVTLPSEDFVASQLLYSLISQGWEVFATADNRVILRREPKGNRNYLSRLQFKEREDET
jgi:hypothetical protein